MRSPRFPSTVLALALLSAALDAGDERARPVEALRREGGFLLFYASAPPAARDRILADYQERVLATRVPRSAWDEVFAAYEEVWTALRCPAATAASAASDLDIEPARLHAALRSHLGQPRAEDAIAAVRASFDPAATATPRRTLRELLDLLLHLGDGSRAPAIDPDATRELQELLVSWVDSWRIGIELGQLERDIRLLESFRDRIPSESIDADALSSALIRFATRLAAASSSPEHALAERREVFKLLNPALDRVRSSPLVPDAELARRLRRWVASTGRFQAPEDLEMEALSRAGVRSALDVRLAVLSSADFLDAAGCPVASPDGPPPSPRDSRPFLLPAATPLWLEYQVYAASGADDARLAGPFRLRVALDNPRRLSPGGEVFPSLPRSVVPGRVYVYAELATPELAYWVDSTCWTLRHALGRIDRLVASKPLERQKEETLARLAWLWECSNLAAVAATPREALEKLSATDGGGPDLLDGAFAIECEPGGAQWRRLPELLTGADGLLDRAAGEELPAPELAELLLQRGELYGFEAPQSGALIDRVFQLRSAPGASVPAAATVVTAIPLRPGPRK